MLTLENISKRFGDIAAIHPLDLEIQKTTTVLLGPSGCGKSTLLRLVVGLLNPDTGQIVFNGKILDNLNIQESRYQMGYVIQEGGLFPHLTARANVILMARYLHWEDHRIQVRLDELTELVRLSSGLLDRYPSELSGGQRQRISLMRALMLDPDLLLLDEPLGSLDPMIRYELQQDLKAVFQKLGKTVLLVTHDLAEAGYLGDNIIMMRSGHVLQRGGFHELIHNPADPFIEQFVRAQRDPIRAIGQDT